MDEGECSTFHRCFTTAAFITLCTVIPPPLPRNTPLYRMDSSHLSQTKRNAASQNVGARSYDAASAGPSHRARAGHRRSCRPLLLPHQTRRIYQLNPSRIKHLTACSTEPGLIRSRVNVRSAFFMSRPLPYSIRSELASW